MADVPVGIVLSGGLDSSLVAAVASEAAEREGKPVPACWTVAEDEDNPDWKRDWSDPSTCPGSGEVGEWKDKLTKKNPGWNDVLSKVKSVPGSNISKI